MKIKGMINQETTQSFKPVFQTGRERETVQTNHLQAPILGKEQENQKAQE